MRLIQLGTDGFGGLRGYFHFDPSRLTLLVDDNERGKSTLLAAVCAALYGLEDDRRSHRVLTPRERWRPWGGGPFGVELEVETAAGRFRIRRDFDRGTVEVRNGAGEDVTAEHREGREDYPVGKRLLGLDAAEFERCAYVRQGDLAQVVPADERERRESSLRARLEAAADSRLGDTVATEALEVLDGALRRYECAELEFTGTIDNALQRLELKRNMLETDLNTLEHDRSTIAAPLTEMATLAAEERALRESIATLEADRRGVLAADARRQLDEHRRRRDELETLRREAAGLAAAAALPADAETQLLDTIAKLEAAEKKVADWDARREDQTARERTRLEAEIAALHVFAAAGAAEADRCVSLAAELRRTVAEDERLRDEIFSQREGLASSGHDPERFQWLTHRLARLGDADQALLRHQTEIALTHQTEVAGLETRRTESSERLRAIDAERGRWTLPGWFLVAIGISGLVAGLAVAALQGLPVLSISFFVAGALLLGTGVALVVLGRKRREDEREESLRGLSEAQRRLATLKQERAETEVGLENLARTHGYRDHVELLREWNEHLRLREESAPVLQGQQQLATVEGRRAAALEEARELLGRFGNIGPTVENLERVAVHLRNLDELRRQLSGLAQSYPWIDEQKEVDEAEARGLRERALRVLQSAGIAHDPSRSWTDHHRELGERMRGRVRHQSLVSEMIPRAEQGLLADAAVAELEARLALDVSGAPSEPRRNPMEIETEAQAMHARLDALQKRRADLRVQVEETLRRVQTEHPEKTLQRQRVQLALDRAGRFRDAIELARRTVTAVAAETHQRWAEHLNQAVAELLHGAGSRLDQIRFGEDLDFSVRLPDGQFLARGKADQQLSSGARDQLYLAVRIAVSQFLSRGSGPLPLLLDDVFATCDDERARSGFRMLLERVLPLHQVILVTCHRQRAERLAALDPGLFAERVQWLDARGAPISR